MAKILCPLKEAVAISGKESALIQGDAIIIYSQLDVFVSATAGKLLTHGVQPGQRIALRLEHRLRSIVLLLACIRIKAVACPISPHLPNERIKNLLATLNAAFWVDDFPCPASPEPRPAEDAARGNHLPKGVHRLESDEVVGQLMDDVDLKLPDKIELNDPATVVFTSGSSGQAKAAVHTYGNHYYSALAANPALQLKSHCKWLLNLPLYHVSGLAVIFRCIKAGAAMVLPNENETVAETMLREGITHLSVVPTQLHKYLQDPEMIKALQGLTVLLVGGAPLSGTLLQKALDLKIPVHTCYGLTETASLATLADPLCLKQTPQSSGKPLRYREYRLDGCGEIWVRGSTRFSGYLQGETLETPFDADGWFATGDIGELDEHGTLCLKGRKDWMFISGGENIYPEEIEAALLQLPGFTRALVVAVDDEKFGQRPVALVEQGKGTQTEAQIKESLAEFLPRFKIPDRILPWTEALPVGDGLKLDRAKLVEVIRSSL